MATYPPPHDPRRTPEEEAVSKAIHQAEQARRTAEYVRTHGASYRDFARSRRTARAQNRANRQSSITGPLLILAAGTALLLIRLGRISVEAAAGWYSQWWPLIFVAAGIILILEWVIDQRALAQGRIAGSRGLGGGVVLLLIVAGIGGALMPRVASANQLAGQYAGLTRLNLEQFFGEKHTSEEERDLALLPESRLTLSNPNGDITLAGSSSDGMLHLTLNKTVYGWSNAEAESRNSRLAPQIDTSGNDVAISFPHLDGARVDLVLSLPKTTTATLTAAHGDITVSDLNAPLVLTAEHGDVELSHIAGQVSVHVASSSATVSAHNIAGDFMLKGHAQDINLADISGEVSLEGDFFGDTHLEQLDGPLSFETSRTRFHTGALKGQIDISPGSSMTGNKLTGPTTLSTHSRNIEFTDVAGDISIVNRDGTVDLTAIDPLGTISVENRSGAITLNLPPHPSINLNAETQDGNIQNNLELTPHKADDKTRLAGQLGEGHDQIDLKTTHADIEVQTGKAESDDQ